MNILGISAYYHDSAAALLQNGKIVAAAQEERFSRIKHDASFPKSAVKYCLEYSGLGLNDLDAIVFYDKPLLKFERLLETYYAFAPKGLKSFISSMPTWLKQKLFLKREIYKELKSISPFKKNTFKLLFPEHHLSHAASAFYPSTFDQAAILTIDGVGEWSTASISLGEANKITILKELHFPHSLGLLYSAFTYYLGFKVNSGEYKLMGLAPYGNERGDQFAAYLFKIKAVLIDIKEDGSIWLDQTYFTYATGLRMVDERKWHQLFKFPKRDEGSPIEQCHCDLALAIQKVTEEVVLKMAKEAKRLTNSNYLCLAGGVALNCVANGKLVEAGIFDHIFIQPAAGDSGGALGAAYAAHHIYYNHERVQAVSQKKMATPYLGPDFREAAVKRKLAIYQPVYSSVSDDQELCDKVAHLLAAGNVIGWFQGRMEFGPRALGNRSILGDPRNPEMQRIINLKIKYRESFRPFAPSVLERDCSQYFEYNAASPYMLQVHRLKADQYLPLPPSYASFSVKEKLSTIRSTLPAITHVDGSARIQTVSAEDNPRYTQLLQAFKDKTGCSVLINTSFNVKGEPIVCAPRDAYACFMQTEMDFLVIGNLLFSKKEQPGFTSPI